MSGVPSTACALVTGTSVLAATCRGHAARPRERDVWNSRRTSHCRSRGVWCSRACSTRGHRGVAGACSGRRIAALDLGVIGRRVPAIRALPQGPQWLDHVVFGAAFGAVLDACDREGARSARM